MKLKDDFKIEIIDTERNLRVNCTLGELRAWILEDVPVIQKPEVVSPFYTDNPVPSRRRRSENK